jgi:heme exporter protein D
VRAVEFGIAGWCWYVSVATPRHSVEADGPDLLEWVMPEWVSTEEYGPDDPMNDPWYYNSYDATQQIFGRVKGFTRFARQVVGLVWSGVTVSVPTITFTTIRRKNSRRVSLGSEHRSRRRNDRLLAECKNDVHI